jgi:5-(carboxyamino)imidazole ribonucleotide mutase
MPRGVPVATVGIDGARNAGLLAARILGVSDTTIASGIAASQQRMADEVRAKDNALQDRLGR